VRRFLPLLAAMLAMPALAQDAAEPPTPASVVAAAPASDWRAIEPADLLVMTLAPDRDGNPRQVVIQLVPAPFSQGWVGNIRALAKAHWWDGMTVYRVVDNWVAQWGAGEDEEGKSKPLPEGLRVVSESEYTSTQLDIQLAGLEERTPEMERAVRQAVEAAQPDPREDEMTADITSTRTRQAREGWHERDSYSTWVEFFESWPVGNDSRPDADSEFWPVHCYASVGVARDLSPDTGTGAELYAVIGHAPRQLDRNIAVVGRVIEGIEHLATLPRGKGEAGVYDDPALRVPIISVRLGDELPEAERPRFRYLGSDTASFAEYVRVRAKRNDSFYNVPAGGIDVCNVQVPIQRRVAEPK